MRTCIVSAVTLMLLAPLCAWGKIGGGDIVFQVSGKAGVLYSHDDHVMKFGIKCKECHYKIYSTVEGHKKTTMAAMEKGESCGVCHDGKRAFGVNTGCVKCHR